MDTRKGPWFIIFSLLFLRFYTHLSIGASIISAGESISGDQTIISEGDGKFELGFFTPGNSQKHYIGIWYRKIRDQTIVWVANREQPLSNKYSSELKLLEDGNLVLFNSSKIPIWSTNLKSTTSNSTEAVLLDTGNFVLRNRLDSLNSSPFLWESFDYPTDTFLPGGKLGLNKITYKSTLLTSWRNREDPAPGMFSLQLDPAGTSQYHILWNRSKIYWTSGTWNGHIFSLVPEMRLNYIFNFTYVSNEEENYFYYTLYNTSIISRLVMDLSGQIHQLSWHEDIGWNLFWSQPRQQCEVHALCGAFGFCTEIALPFCGCLPGFEPRFPIDYLNLSDRSAGCERRFPLQCMNQASVNWKQLFVRMPNMKFPQNAQFLAAGTAEDCESACSNSCPCTAYAYGTGGCSVWNDDLLNAKQLSDGDTGGGDLYIKSATSKLPSKLPDQQRRLLSIVVPVSTVIGILSLGTFICFWRRRMFNQKGIPRAEDILRDNGNKDLNVAFFDFRSIAFATSNFSDSNKLGQGGFGPVYKGKLSTGQEIAVKRLSKSSGQGLEEFKNEVILIAKLQHRNLVKLIGYCIQGDEKMLLHEYMLNKSLDYFLFDQNRRSLLDWGRRLTIVLGIARGLLYLHQDSRLRIIHRDLKASNILLDEDMNPKISDFGLARMFEGNQTQANTNRVVGTYGYMSPEYALDGLFSVKSDVFSFGILLLEIISGKKNTGFYHSEHSLSLLGYAWRLWREEKGLELMDPLLNEDNNVQDVLKCIQVGLLCVQGDAKDRPTMATVVAMLISETVNLPTPKQPAFYRRRSLSTVESSSSGPENCSKNEITLSNLEGR